MRERVGVKIGDREIARAIAQQDVEAASDGVRWSNAVVGNSEVLFAIAIEIAHRYRDRKEGSAEVCGRCEADRHARRRRRDCQRERPGRGLDATIEGSDRDRVYPRRMRVRHPHHARHRIAFETAVEVGRRGNIDARRVSRRGIRRHRRVIAKQN